MTELQELVKQKIAPYKYPRAIEFLPVAAAHQHRQAPAFQAPRAQLNDKNAVRQSAIIWWPRLDGWIRSPACQNP